MTPSAAKKFRQKAYQSEMEEMASAIRELNGDVRFQRYTAGLHNLKDLAVMDAAGDETLRYQNTTIAALGRVRAFQDMIDLIASQPVLLVETEPQQ